MSFFRPPHAQAITQAITLVALMLTLNTAALAAAAEPLKPEPVGSFRELRRLLAQKTINQAPPSLKSTTLQAGDGEAADHSQTNVQVAGVDESDTVKTDGRLIYRIQDGKVLIVEARPASAMAVTATLEFDDGFHPHGLYVRGRQLVVVGSAWHSANWHSAKQPEHDLAPRLLVPQHKMAIWWPVIGQNRVLAKVYDLSDRAHPVLARQLGFSGDYLSSRRIGDSVYLIGRQYPQYLFHTLAKGRRPAISRDNSLPRITDSVVNGGQERPLRIRDLFYFPGFVDPNYVIVAGLRLDALDRPASIDAYLGGGDVVYASKAHLYLSAADYPAFDGDGQQTALPQTHIYQFKLDGGAVSFGHTGTIPGTVFNPYAMDEHDGHFRIATSSGQWMADGEHGGHWQTWSGLYVLDAQMAITGQLERLAEGQHLSAVRFMADRAYLATDADQGRLAVVDVGKPSAPVLLGELALPGFSHYLHPVDQNHLLSLGNDSMDGDYGPTPAGLRLALFDVSDVNHPRLKHSLTLGASGSHSPAQWDPKALWLDLRRGLLGFPLSLTEQQAGSQWPEPVFQGAHVYAFSVDGGFQHRAAITHLGTDGTDHWRQQVDRLLTIGRHLYTLSPARILAHDLGGFALAGTVELPTPPEAPVGCQEPAPYGLTAAIDCPAGDWPTPDPQP